MSNTIPIFAPENLWFTSDTHFGHENIIRFCNRPFKNAAEMNAELIRRWNQEDCIHRQRAAEPKGTRA